VVEPKGWCGSIRPVETKVPVGLTSIGHPCLVGWVVWGERGRGGWGWGGGGGGGWLTFRSRFELQLLQLLDIKDGAVILRRPGEQ